MPKNILKKHHLPGVNRLGRTALHYAALERNLPETQRLLTAGYNPSAKDDDGFSPLHFAAQSNCIAVSEALLSAGAEINATDCHGNTPLFRAVFNSGGEGGLITLLLSAGADPHLENSHGISPFELARTITNYDLVKFFNVEPVVKA